MSPGKIRWEIPQGSIGKLASVSSELGAPGAGGPSIIPGGLALTGYTPEKKFHAFDLATDEIERKQFVVIPAGGHGMYGSTKADSVVARKLKH